jgi:rRNA maturation endonuclease Nob1
MNKKCTWSEDEDGLWHTECHQIHQFFDGTPTENSYKFCPYCGKPLKEEKYKGEDV